MVPGARECYRKDTRAKQLRQVPTDLAVSLLQHLGFYRVAHSTRSADEDCFIRTSGVHSISLPFSLFSTHLPGLPCQVVTGGAGLSGYASAFLNESVVDEGVYRTYNALVPEHLAAKGAAAAFDFMRTVAAEVRTVAAEAADDGGTCGWVASATDANMIASSMLLHCLIEISISLDLIIFRAHLHTAVESV